MHPKAMVQQAGVAPWFLDPRAMEKKLFPSFSEHRCTQVMSSRS